LTTKYRQNSGSFAATLQFENLEIHKVFLRLSNLDLQQNCALPAWHLQSAEAVIMLLDFFTFVC